jgi:hypothetical protein
LPGGFVAVEVPDGGQPGGGPVVLKPVRGGMAGVLGELSAVLAPHRVS